MKKNTILTVAGTVISVASLALAGMKLYKEYKSMNSSKAIDGKLDNRLEESFPASDATAVY